MDESQGSCGNNEATDAHPTLANDQLSFSSLFHRTQRAVFALLTRMVRDKDKVEELTQETFFKAWRSRRTFDKASDGLPWILETARTVAIDYFRYANAKKRGKTISFADLPVRDGNEAGPPADPRDRHQGSPLDGLVLSEAIEMLRESERKLLDLYLAEFSYGEISELTGQSESAIGAALSRIRQKLRVALKDYQHAG